MQPTPARSLASRLALLNLSTFLFALIGVLVKVIALSPGQIAVGRGVFAALALVVILLIRRHHPFRLNSAKDLPWVVLLGLFLCGNWYFYFVAIQVSSVAIAVIALFTYPLITALLEPILFRERYRWVDLLGAVTTVIGIALIAQPDPSIPGAAKGVLAGLASACSIAANNLLSRKMVRTYPTGQLMFLQFVVATIFFLPAVIVAPPVLDLKLIGQLFILGAVLSAGAYALFLDSLRYFSSSTASVLLSLQPLEATLLAWWILDQRPGKMILIGGVLITGSVLSVILYHARLKRRNDNEPEPSPVRSDP